VLKRKRTLKFRGKYKQITTDVSPWGLHVCRACTYAWG
jgi:hypothetical protein